MTKITAQLGGTASSIAVGKIGHGLMFMTAAPTPVPDETCFESIKAGIDALPDGTKMLLNSSEFYGRNPLTANLELLARFFDKYPAYADKVFLSVKGAFNILQFKPDASPEGIRRSVDNVLAALRGTKKVDLFECARVDPNYPIEDTMHVLAQLVKEGKFDHVGMSECKAETIRKAHAVHPVALVEIEVSPWMYEKEGKDVIKTCKELGISVAAYSPLGQGVLSGKITKPDDLEPGDFRRHFQRFQEENLKHNIALADAIKAIANRKGCTAAQMCIAWVCSRGAHVIPIPGSSRKERTLENVAAGDISLTLDEVKEIDDIIDNFEVRGGRYNSDTKLLWG
ncbi:NADP-dependent oxidoreductase domain-containing protein [Cyathus striatus]|nr:NADP-dependent oxidoreductase domain-containing protein [Cyathus striatus]